MILGKSVKSETLQRAPLRNLRNSTGSVRSVFGIVQTKHNSYDPWIERIPLQ
jgi:hypothetical protein